MFSQTLLALEGMKQPMSMVDGMILTGRACERLDQ